MEERPLRQSFIILCILLSSDRLFSQSLLLPRYFSLPFVQACLRQSTSYCKWPISFSVLQSFPSATKHCSFNKAFSDKETKIHKAIVFTFFRELIYSFNLLVQIIKPYSKTVLIHQKTPNPDNQKHPELLFLVNHAFFANTPFGSASAGGVR